MNNWSRGQVKDKIRGKNEVTKKAFYTDKTLFMHLYLGFILWFYKDLSCCLFTSNLKNYSSGKLSTIKSEWWVTCSDCPSILCCESLLCGCLSLMSFRVQWIPACLSSFHRRHQPLWEAPLVAPELEYKENVEGERLFSFTVCWLWLTVGSFWGVFVCLCLKWAKRKDWHLCCTLNI